MYDECLRLPIVCMLLRNDGVEVSTWLGCGNILGNGALCVEAVGEGDCWAPAVAGFRCNAAFGGC
jgi:hypothetical protein